MKPKSNAVELTHISLFTGIGGIDLAAEWAGFETILFVEIDKYCQKVLNKHWPDMPIIGDIKDVTKEKVMAYTKRQRFRKNRVQCKEQENTRTSTGLVNSSDAFTRQTATTNYETITLITGGFPCQPVSQAGKRKGKEDDRWLWPEMLRVISDVRPTWIVAENVTGLLTMGFYDCLSDLESEGYETIPFVIPACAVNAPHRRDRIFIVAHSNEPRKKPKYGTDIGKEGNIWWDKESNVSRRLSEFGQGKDVAYAQSNRTQKRGCQFNATNREQDVANTNTEGLQGHWRLRECGGEFLTWKGNSPLKGIWESEPELGRVVDGLSSELDIARQIRDWCENEYSNNKKKNSERGRLTRQMLRSVWENRHLAKTSPQSYIRAVCDSVSEVPLRDTQSRWFLGAWIEEDKGLCDMWQAFYSSPQQEAHDLQYKLLERAWEKKRNKTVASRVDRLRCLGNAVVPQQIYPILKAIADIELKYTRKRTEVKNEN